jgi:hypothetical protein
VGRILSTAKEGLRRIIRTVACSLYDKHMKFKETFCCPRCDSCRSQQGMHFPAESPVPITSPSNFYAFPIPSFEFHSTPPTLDPVTSKVAQQKGLDPWNICIYSDVSKTTRWVQDQENAVSSRVIPCYDLKVDWIGNDEARAARHDEDDARGGFDRGTRSV